MISAEQLMVPTDLIIPEMALVKDIAVLLREKRLAGLPVKNNKGKVSGLVTITEIFAAVAVLRNMYRGKEGWFNESAGKSLPIKEVYRREVIAVEPQSSIEDIIKVMLETDVVAVPVMNQDRSVLYGIIGRHDITWAVFGRS